MQKLATLPVELWWNILDHAVHTPRLFDTAWDHSPDFLIWTGWGLPDPTSSHSGSLQTKLSVCRVSKSWREIGVKLLYQHLLLTEDTLGSGVLSKLIAIFEQHANQGGYGRSTKRVDVLSEGSYLPWLPSLLRLLGLCHNVRIFNISCHFEEADAQTQDELSSLLQTRFSHSLRRMKYYVHTFNQLACLPNVPLRALELSAKLSSTIHPPPAITTISTLCLDLLYNGYQPPSWRFPALRHLTFSNIAGADMPSLQLFMSNHGPQLHSLYLTVYEDSFFIFLPELLAPATNLRSLTLPPFWIDLPPPGTSFPSITHIAFEAYFSPCIYDTEVLGSGTVFPGLQCVRWLDLSIPVEDLQHINTWISLLEAGTKWNIRFEDKNCQLIQI